MNNSCPETNRSIELTSCRIIIILLHFIENIDGIRSRINMVYCYWKRTKNETDRQRERKGKWHCQLTFLYTYIDILCHFFIWVGVERKKSISFEIRKRNKHLYRYSSRGYHSSILKYRKSFDSTHTHIQYHCILLHCHSSISPLSLSLGFFFYLPWSDLQ